MNQQGLCLAQVVSIQRLVQMQYLECGPDYRSQCDTKEGWHLFYLDKGQMQLQWQEHSHTLQRGQMMLLPPGQTVEISCPQKEPPNLVWLAFQTADGATLVPLAEQIIALQETERLHMASLLELARLIFQQGQPLSLCPDAPPEAQQRFRIDLELLLLELLMRERSQQEEKPITLMRDRSYTEVLVRVQRYLEDHLGEKLTLSEICRSNLVGRSYLQKIFREKTGGGVMEYFGTMKIEKAKELIREREHNFTQISQLLGYQSVQYFSRHFKKVTGMTPSDYAVSIRVLTLKARATQWDTE